MNDADIESLKNYLELHEIDTDFYKTICLNDCTITEIGYNGTRYVVVVNPSGYGIKEMYCLDNYEYSAIYY